MCGQNIQIVISEPQVDDHEFNEYNVATGIFDEVRHFFEQSYFCVQVFVDVSSDLLKKLVIGLIDLKRSFKVRLNLDLSL